MPPSSLGALAQAWMAPEAALGLSLPDPVTAAIPFFFPLILAEVAAAWLMGRQVYNLRQSTSNMAAGVLSVLMGLATKALHLFPYCWLHARYALAPWPGTGAAAGWAAWLLSHLAALLTVDLGFYLFHRAAHACNLGWAAHVTHHSSPDYNLSTALRQGAGESTFSWLFYLPLALLAPPTAYALHRGVNTVFQFFVHSELVPKLWWPIELVFNTPSHHRVHHARNYGRRNFAGILIIWDRLLGTFEEEQPESRPPVYGLDAQKTVQGTYAPLWHQAHHLVATLRLAAASLSGADGADGSGAAGRLQGVLSALFTRRPGPGMVLPSVTDAMGKQLAAAPAGAGVRKGQQTASGAERWEQRPLCWADLYAAVHFFVIVLPLSFVLLLHIKPLATSGPQGAGALAASALLAAWGVLTSAGMCAGTRAAIRAEALRLAAWQAACGMAALRGAGLGLPPWAVHLAWEVGFICSLSTLLLAAQLGMTPRSGPIGGGDRVGADGEVNGRAEQAGDEKKEQ